MNHQILEILQNIKPNIEQPRNLVTDGLLDSLDIMTLVGDLEDEFGIEFDPDDILAENFDSVDSIAGILRRYKENA